MRPKWPMSAYSASAPVTASTTDAERDERDAAVVDEEAQRRRCGESARRIAGVLERPRRAPATARTANQTRHDRPEQPADGAGAEALDREQHGEDHERDRDDDRARGSASTTSRPSTADSTEIAGVIIPSP